MYSRHFYFRYYSDSYDLDFLHYIKPLANYCWFSVPHFDSTKCKYYRYVLFTTSSLSRFSFLPSYEIKTLGYLRYCFLSEFRGPFTFLDLSLLNIVECCCN